MNKIIIFLQALFVGLFLAACNGSGPSNSAGVGSLSWQEIEIPSNSGYYLTVWTFAPDDVWLGGAGLWHFDGTKWTDHSISGVSFVADFLGFAPDDLWAISDTKAFHWDGSTWSEVPGPGSSFSALWRMWGFNSNQVWVANENNSRVFRWNGSSWQQTTLQFVQVSSIWGASSTDMWLSGIGRLYRWDGASWSEFSDGHDYPTSASGMWGSSADDVWAIGGSGELSHFDGSTWTATDIEAMDNYTDVWGASANSVFAVGTRGRSARFNGSTWSQGASLGLYQNFIMVHGSSAENVYATVYDSQNTKVRLMRLQ